MPDNEKTSRDLSAEEWRRQIILLLNRINDPEMLAKIDSVINDIYCGKIRL